MRKMCARAVAILAALITYAATANSASARWFKATSEHMIVYSEDGENSLRQYTANIESFHELLRTVLFSAKETSGPKLSIYLVRGRAQISQAWPQADRWVGGFYSASPGAIAAISGKGFDAESSRATMFHEYAHHFMSQYGAYAYPIWFVEGFAEYVQTAEVRPDHFSLGQYPDSMYTLLERHLLPWEKIVTTKSLSGMTSAEAGKFYAQSWLLTHYLMHDSKNSAALQTYLRQYATEGKADWSAFTQAVGMDEKALDKQLWSYLMGRMQYTTIKMQPFDSKKIQIEALPPSADDLLLAKLRADFQHPGRAEKDDADPVAKKTDEQMLARVRATAAQFPGDLFAQKALASVEISYGGAPNALTALASVQEAQRDAEWFYLDGLTRYSMSAGNLDKQTEYLTEARKSLGKSFKADPNRYQTLYLYAQSFAGEPISTDDNILNILLRAYDLAPQVEEIGATAAGMLIDRGRHKEAIVILRIIASQPHLDDSSRASLLKLLQSAQLQSAGAGAESIGAGRP